MNVSLSVKSSTRIATKQSEQHSGSGGYDNDIDVLLRRWGRWLRAGESGLSSIGHGGGGIRDEQYRDVVAEMLDQVIAQMPRQQRRAIMAIWLYRKSETAAAEDWRMPRGRFKTVLSNGIGWLCGILVSRIDDAPTLENVDRWEKRQ